MSIVSVNDTVIFRDLKVAPGASVFITEFATGTLATLYADGSGSITIANPLTSDSNGNWSAYIDTGRYTVRASLDGDEDIKRLDAGAGETTLAGSGSILAPIDRANFVCCEEPVLLPILNWEAIALGSDAPSSSSFPVTIPQGADPQDLYVAATGEFTAIAQTSHTLHVIGTFGLSTGSIDETAEANVIVQKYSVEWSDHTTICTLSASTGNPDSVAVDTVVSVNLDIGEKVRVYYELTEPTSNGVETCTANSCEFTFTYTETE